MQNGGRIGAGRAMVCRIASRLATALAMTALVVPTGIAAQTYPDKAVQLYIGYSLAGASGQIARIVAQALSPVLGKPVEVVPLLGNDGILAATKVAKATPDGYTLLLT